jgi:hypothetical protein
MEKNKNLIISIIVIIIAAIVLIMVIKNNESKIVEPTVDIQPTNIPKNIDTKQAIISDTTSSINESLDKIDLTDTSVNDLKGVDQELQNL